MKRLYLLLSLFVLFVCSGCLDIGTKDSSPWEGSYNDNSAIEVDVRLPGTIPDYTKSDEYSNMCWAVAVCNSLEYAGHIADNSDCMDTMKAEYGNNTGYTLNSYNWYMQEVLATDPRDFYQSEYSSTDIMDFITEQIEDGNIVVFNLSALNGTTGHVVTVYGFRVTDTGYTLYVVDGDDHRHTRTIEVSWHVDGWGIHSSGTYNKYDPNYAFSISSATQ